MVYASWRSLNKTDNMAQIKFKKLRAQNFRQYASLNLDLPDRGCILIDGRNGHGKTTILEGIRFVISGKSMLDESSDNLIKNGEKECWYEIWMMMDSDPVIVRRARKRSGSETVTVTRRGQGKRVYSKTEAKEVLEDLFGLTAEVLMVSLIYTPSFRFFQADRSEKMRVMRPILELDRYQSARDLAAK